MSTLRWVILLSVTIGLLGAMTLIIATAEAEEIQNQSNPAIPVPIWSVPYDTYTASFIREDYIAIFASHGDIDLGYNYISLCAVRGGSYNNYNVVPPANFAYIYTINGTLIKSFNAEGTYRLSDYTKVWDRCGFFSGNGRYLVEDPYVYSSIYGTYARVVDLATGTTRPIDFTGTSGLFYPAQLDYHGTYLAMGEGHGYDLGSVILFKFNGTSYQKIWKSEVIGDIRRIAMTLDAKYIIYGALNNPYLYIAERSDNDTVSVVSKIPLEGGVGALGITDVWNIGYILVGTDNGHIYIFDAKYNGTPKNPSLVIHINNSAYPQGTGTTARFYNPFYNRYNPPENIRLVAFSTFSAPYVSIIVDIPSKTFWRYSGDRLGAATAVSLQGNYLFAGQIVFTTILPDVQSGNPRIRFSGTTYFNYGEKPYDLSQPIVINADSRDYHAYFTGGSVKLTSIVSVSRPIMLIKDTDVLDGKLGILANRGMIKTATFFTQSGTVEGQSLKVTSDNGIVYSATHKMNSIVYLDLMHITNGSVVDSGVVIKVPLDAPISPFERMNFSADLAIAGVAVGKSLTDRILSISGIELATGTMTQAMSRSLWDNLYNEFSALAELANWDGFEKFVEKMGAFAKLGKFILSKLGYVMIIDAVVGEGLQYSAEQSLKVTVTNVPIIEDTDSGKKYAVVVVLIPTSEADRADEYVNYIAGYLKAAGVSEIHSHVVCWGNDWSDYQNKLKNLSLPDINYVSLIEAFATSKGLDPKKLRVVEYDILISGVTTGSSSFLATLTGGADVPIRIVVEGKGIEVVGITRDFIATDPSQIVALVPTVKINGKVYNLYPSNDGAITQFMLPVGVSKLVVDFGSYYTGTFRIDADVIIKKDFELERRGIYNASFHYNWTVDVSSKGETKKEDVLVRVNKIELLDMPDPPIHIERTYIYAYGKYTHNVTSAFELASVQGGKYYYITKKNTTFLDPANGATMQPCKTYVFRYFTEMAFKLGFGPAPWLPPMEKVGNAWVKAAFNGTLPTSTLPRHAVAITGSQYVSQTITTSSTASVTVADTAGGNPVKTVVTTKAQTFTDSVPKDGSVKREYEISDLVAKAIDLKKNGKASFVVVNASIVKADQNEITDDDYSEVSWYPSLEVENKTVAFDVYVIDKVSRSPLNATVVLKDLNGVLYASSQTSNGWANFTVYTGGYYVVVNKTGYKLFNKSVYVYSNMTYTAELEPEEINLPLEGKNVTLAVRVYNANNGTPIAGADVMVDYNETNSSSRTWKKTDENGIASFTVKVGYVTINAGAEGYYPYEDTIYVSDNMTYNVALIPMVIEEYVVLTVKTEYSDGSVASGVTIRVLDSSTEEEYFSGTTDEYGLVTALIQKNYTVIVRATKGSWTDEQLVVADSNKTIKFTIPTQPPTPPIYAYVSAVVQYRDGFPIQGASVVIKDSITQETIFSDVTDGTGYAEFAIPLYRVIDICASYESKEVIPNCYRWETVEYPSEVYMFLVNETSPWFRPEVGIVDISVQIHRGQGWYYGDVEHLVETKIYSNVNQRISLYVKLFNPTTKATISEKTVQIDVVEGHNVIWTWLDVNITGNATDAQVYGKITAYQYDTDPSNNELYGNIVTFKPFLDMYPSIIWKPVKQRIDTAILPGDIIEIDIAYVIPAGGIKDIEASYSVKSYNLYKNEMDLVENKTYILSTVEPTTIYKNFTVVVPFTNKIIVNASIYHPLEDNGLNNQMTLEIPVFEDTELVKVDVPPIVMAGEKTTVKVYLKSNAVGFNYRASVATSEIIGMTDFDITKPEMVVEVEVTPKVSGNKFFETQTWYVNLMGYDYYDANNEKTVTVMVWALPWWLFIFLVILVILILLLLVKKLLFAVRMVGGGEFRFFRRLDRGDGFGGDARLQAKIRELDEDVRKFRFFGRVR
jgi:hypothetical protein